MAKRNFTLLTDAMLITAVVQKGMAEVITTSLLEIGVQGATVHGAMGTGVRERLGVLGVAVDVERDVVSVMVSREQVDRVFERVFLAGRLDTPGMGFMYVNTLMQAATYVPPNVIEQMSHDQYDIAG